MTDLKQSTSKEFVITRVLDAPRDLVWKAHSEKEHLKKWWGPEGFEIRGAKLDFKPGGVFHYQMKSSTGEEIWAQFVYREISPQDRIVWVNSFSEITGGIMRHPGVPNWPLEVLITLTLVEQNGKTTLTLRACSLNASDEECRVFENHFDSLTENFSATFDRLAAHVARL